MLKKYLNCFLIFSILNLTSCTSLEVISQEDIAKGKADIDFNDELYVITKDFTKYHFSSHNFQIIDDTLYGNGTMEKDSLITPFKGSVSLQNVINFEQNRTNSGETIILIAGIISIGLITLAIIGLSEIPDN
jgi:hypothetical protein